MVKVKLRQKDPEDENKWIEKEITLDGYLKTNLDEGIKLLHKDFDQVWFVDGYEGSGKSDLASTCAYYVNKEETRHTLIKRICQTAESFENAIMSAEKYEAVVLDEAYGGMSSSGSIAKVNRVLQRRFTEIRAKNLFVFILAPSFMDIMRYFALWRSKCLLHVYLGKQHERGYCAFFNYNRKKTLYIKGKKQFYNYNVVAANFVFRFSKQMDKIVDKVAYDKQKQEQNLERNKKELSTSQIRRETLKEVAKRLEEWENAPTREVKAWLLGVSTRTYYDYLRDSKLEGED